MISRKYRFHGHNSLNFLFRNGKTVRADFLSMRYVEAKGDDYRLAVVVSKKVSKSAVVRNRIRRRIYEIVRLMHKESGQPIKFDMMITVFDEQIAQMPHDNLQQMVLKLMQKARIY